MTLRLERSFGGGVREGVRDSEWSVKQGSREDERMVDVVWQRVSGRILLPRTRHQPPHTLGRGGRSLYPYEDLAELPSSDKRMCP